MVANAGILGKLGPMLEGEFWSSSSETQVSSASSASVEDFRRVHAVNVEGVFLCYKYAAEQMIKQGRGGRIIGSFSFSMSGIALNESHFRRGICCREERSVVIYTLP